MKLYGLMITKDDHDVFRDWCLDQLRLYDGVVCLDGSEGDETQRIAGVFAERLIYLHEKEFYIPSKTDHGLRRVVHEEITRRFGLDNWIMCCHADEFCYHDPRKVAERAFLEGYDLVTWFSLHFLPHPNELPSWERLQNLPIAERSRYYHWSPDGVGYPWLEDRLYHNGPGVCWDFDTHGSVAPHNLKLPAPFHPILRHYTVVTTDLHYYQRKGPATYYRTQRPALENRSGLPLAVKKLEDFFVGSYPPYHRCDYFDGTFNQSWNMGEKYRPDQTGQFAKNLDVSPAKQPYFGSHHA
jgi:hypothetical protein